MVRNAKAVAQHDALCGAIGIADPVVADVIARTKIRVGVVVESAPTDAAGIAVVPGQLIMHAGMPPDVLRFIDAHTPSRTSNPSSSQASKKSGDCR